MVAIILTFLLLVPISGHAATYYVSTSGNNANNGSQESPWRTVAYAVDQMFAGDTTFVMPGTYDEGLIRFRRSGANGAPIQLRGMPGAVMPTINFLNGMIGGYVVGTDMILIQQQAGFTLPIGWITIEGLEIRGGQQAIKMYNCHDCVFRGNWLHHNGHGILANGSTRILVERNIINHNGQFEKCEAGLEMCNGDHGIYAHGTYWTIIRNEIYDNMGYGIQQNGSSSSAFSTSKHPSVEFAGAQNWIIANNTLAYSRYRPGMVLWGSLTANTRVENNIFYENGVMESTSAGNGVQFTSPGSTSGIQFRNNISYATGSGGLNFIVGGTQGTHYTLSGNSVNTINPSFINGGSNALPGTPNWALAAGSGAIDFGRVHEFPYNGAAPEAGAHETFAPSSARIDGVNLDITFGMSLNVPVIGGTGGFTVACSPTCGTITVTGVTRIADSVLRLTTSGWSGGFCVDTQTITASYASGSGTASDSARIGNTNNQPLHSFSNFAVTNQCSGSGGPTPPVGQVQYLKLNGNATDDSGNANNGTVSGGSFVAARYGQGWQGEAGVESYVDTGLLNGFNPATQAFTIAYGVFIPEGEVGITRNLGGFNLGSGQRLHVYKHGSTQNFRLATQTNAGGTATEFSVTAGWHHVCIEGNGSGTIKLWINGTAGTVSGASVQTVTSYVTASTYRIGVPSGISASNSGAHIYDEFLIYNTAGHCANLWAAWEQQTPPPGSGTLTQVAVQAQELYTVSGNPVNYGAPNTRVDVIDGGAIAHVYQINCDPGPCDPTALQYRYEVDGGGFNQVVPDTPTEHGVYFYGSFNAARANTGSAGAALTGSLSHTEGSTQLTSAATPSVDLGDGSSMTLRYIVRFTNGNIGKIYKFRLYDQTGLPLDAYTNDGHVRIVKKRMRGRF